jgi:hypothetical protein
VVAIGGSPDVRAADGSSAGVQIEPEDLTQLLRVLAGPEGPVIQGTTDVGVVHRRTDVAEIYFLANTSNAEQRFVFVPGSERSHLEEWDVHSGEVRSRRLTSASIALTLAPYAATVLVTCDATAGTEIAAAEPTVTRRRGLDAPWSVRFHDDPVPPTPRPVTLPHRWEDERPGYSGGATYATTFGADESWLAAGTPPRVRLDFGTSTSIDAGSSGSAGIRGSSYRVQIAPPIREVAVVTLNGQECGRLWAPPYVVDITHALQPGTNELQVDVFNTAANALAADPAIRALAAESEARYGRRFHVQDLDLALDAVESGLLSVPDLTW